MSWLDNLIFILKYVLCGWSAVGFLFVWDFVSFWNLFLMQLYGCYITGLEIPGRPFYSSLDYADHWIGDRSVWWAVSLGLRTECTAHSNQGFTILFCDFVPGGKLFCQSSLILKLTGFFISSVLLLVPLVGSFGYEHPSYSDAWNVTFLPYQWLICPPFPRNISWNCNISKYLYFTFSF